MNNVTPPILIENVFDDKRFLETVPEQQAKEIKNYYYVYNNLLNNSDKNVDKKIQNIKKYIDIKNQLEESFSEQTFRRQLS